MMAQIGHRCFMAYCRTLLHIVAKIICAILEGFAFSVTVNLN